ncbi:hypothetical protein GW17_00004391 [Ensete ventricosum]|nr:hypothetical protein GW17_00004391 [Ensete ventricosum]
MFWSIGELVHTAYTMRGCEDGDMCVVEVKTMTISQWSKKLHLGTRIKLLEFCPKERYIRDFLVCLHFILSEWQIYLLLLGFFMASLLVFYILYENSDSFWNFPQGRNQPARPSAMAFTDPQSSDDSPW